MLPARSSMFFMKSITLVHLFTDPTSLTECREKTPKPAFGMFNWISAFRRLSDEDALNQQSLDSYLFIRFFKMITLICLVGTCITWVTLLPVNYMGGGGKTELSSLMLSNVNDPQKYYWHAGAAWMFLGEFLFRVNT